MCLAVAACSKDELPGTHGEFASLTLSVASSQNDVKTRAVSADADEQRINNLYIFIFNPDGSVDCRNYISSLSASSWTGTIGGLTCGTGKSVAAIANTDNTVVDITREMLDGIASRAALDSCVVNLRGKFIERGTNFLMTGVAENVTVTAGSPVSATVPLTRVDSKIRFRVTEASGVTFTSDDWRVVSVPRKAGMMASRTDLCTDPAECFDTEWAHFEEDGKTFAFYSLESVLTPRAEIPVTAGTYEEQYALREKKTRPRPARESRSPTATIPMRRRPEPASSCGVTYATRTRRRAWKYRPMWSIRSISEAWKASTTTTCSATPTIPIT